METNIDTTNNNSSKTEELLLEILNHQKKSSRITRIAAFAVIFIVALFAISLVIITPKIVGFIDHAKQSLAEVDVLIAESDTVISEINDITSEVDVLVDQANTLFENSNAMVEENTDAITEAVQKLNSVDFDTLNKAIKDLSEVVEPLANFFGKFNR